MKRSMLKRTQFLDNDVNIKDILVNDDELNKKVQYALANNRWLLMVVVGTKPDFYKQYSLLYYA